MASGSATLENQLHSAQKNLLFLQQDHANTLKGLHAEISRLQQHCTDLTYELTVKSSDPTDSSEARCLALHQRCEELEAQLKLKEEENAELLRELEQKTAMISVLEDTLRERERKYLDELKQKSQRLAVLSGELEQRASTIAYLTSQLHATKRRLLAGGSGAEGGGAGAAGGGSGAGPGASATPTQSPASSPAYRPAPPVQPQPPDTPTRRRMRKSLSQPLHAEWAELYRQGAGPEGRRLILREALEAMPDPTPFLQPRDPPSAAPPHHHAPPQPLHKSRPAVIPPIAPSDRSDPPGFGSGSGSPSPTPTASPSHSHTPTRLPSVPLGPPSSSPSSSGPLGRPSSSSSSSAGPFSPKGSPARQQRAHVGVAHRIPHSPPQAGPPVPLCPPRRLGQHSHSHTPPHDPSTPSCTP
ncbi:hypothetical protein ACEWY4_011700 [Coilia grayii]|uniref:CCDC92/74 N-terminal domain-containing protein n=1 Tax=Coilia grayii TaxID=363190 RepID=A0ABD1JYD3_9TELE